MSKDRRRRYLVLSTVGIGILMVLGFLFRDQVHRVYHNHVRDRAIAKYCEELEGPSISTARAAARALGQMGPDGAAAVPKLTAALKWPGLEAAAAEALGRIGPPAVSAKPVLDEMVSASCRGPWNTDKAIAAAWALWRITDGGEKERVLPILTAELYTPHPFAIYCAQLLGELGADAKDAIQDLEEMANRDVTGPSKTPVDPVKYRAAALEAIRKIRGVVAHDKVDGSEAERKACSGPRNCAGVGAREEGER
jgi:hypothetical protein